MNAAQAEAAMRALGPLLSGTKEEREAERAKRRERAAEIVAQFREWLADEYAYQLSDRVQDLIWAKAWEDGHSYGYHSVEQRYIDYAELIVKAFDFS